MRMKLVLAIIWIIIDILMYFVGVELVSGTYWIVNTIFAIVYFTTPKKE